MPRNLIAFVVFAISVSGAASAAESICFGTVANGRLENGVRLPEEGKNFAAYSSAGVTLGRTYAHSKVAEIVLAAYRALERSALGKVFVCGETGWPSGGKISPHRTHRNGLSVDFFVPVVDASGRSIRLPTDASNKFGYSIDFDASAKYQGNSIDFEAMAEHLYQLDIAANARGSGIALVIFERPYLPRLFATKRGAYLKSKINFMKGNAWVRHDEHYHVNFSIPCRPING
jgi:penicillin-insensitive murein DD-endopeptidase